MVENAYKKQYKPRISREDNAHYQRKYRENKQRFEKNVAQTLANFGGGAEKVFVELVRASNSNPLIGITVSLVSADILLRLGIIDHLTYTFILSSVGVIEGAAVAGTIITDITQLFSFSKSQNPTPDPITPTATTIVYPTESQKDLQTLIGKKQ